MIPAFQKKVVVLIESCSRCPYIMVDISKFESTGVFINICTKVSPCKELPETHNIPDWCPLEDA
jgi:hypothetical protein